MRAVMPLTPHGNTKYVITAKRSHGLVRNEMEAEVSERTFIQLLSKCRYTTLKKHRIKFNCPDLGVEELCVDSYDPSRVSLKVVEVEFASEEEAKAWKPPEWFDLEVTGREEFKNQALWSNLMAGYKIVVENDGQLKLLPT